MTERSIDGFGLRAPGVRALGDLVVVPLFACTLFVSSGLLFFVEPMFAKMVLPLLGGTPAVWNTCMVCFQALLLGAYAYGHWSIRWLGIRRQIIVQFIVLLAALAALPVALPSGWEPTGGRNPIGWLIAVLLVGVGLPFFAVSTTGPVVQRWFSSSGHRAGGDPYFLYAASNLGSMVALLGYPTLLEPFLRLAEQSRVWTYGYVGLMGLMACCVLFTGRNEEGNAVGVLERIVPSRRVRWILLAMVPSSLLLGSTTFITTDIAAVPLFWIVPLALYLLSFILVFASRPIFSHRLMVRLQPVFVLGVALFVLGRVGQPIWMVLALHLAALFVSSMVCHGELAKDRPTAGRLTDFYLTMSLGGMLGGLFNGLVAPMIFHSALEYPIGLIAACALSASIASSGRKEISRGIDWVLDIGWPVMVGALAWGMPRAMAMVLGRDAISAQMVALGIAVLAATAAIRRKWRLVGAVAALFLVATIGGGRGDMLTIRRSFFGIHRVIRNPDGPFNDLFHGTTVHGRQFVDSEGMPVQATVPLTYYTRSGPIGEFLTRRIAQGGVKRMSVIGLGVGSLAAYADSGMQLTYYEIDPAVRWFAEDSGYFSFLKAARDRGAKVRIVMGDARLTLREAAKGSCDVLVLDAFSGDAIPVHLLTREAMRIYLDKLSEHGVLAIHVSNMYLDLLPICSALAADAGCVGMYRNDLEVSPKAMAGGKSGSQWVVIARGAEVLGIPADDRSWKRLPATGGRVAWSDDFSNVLSVFRWR